MTDFEDLIAYANDGYNTPDEQVIIEDYKKCLGEANADRIALYAQLGPTIRHRIMNMNHYLHNLNYGFTHKDLESSNWLKRGVFEIERVEFEISSKNSPHIELGKSPNGKWSFGWSYSTGGSGSGCAVNVFRKPLNNRSECFDIAIAHAEQYFKGCQNKNDSINFNEKLIRQVLDAIDKIKCGSSQLALF